MPAVAQEQILVERELDFPLEEEEALLPLDIPLEVTPPCWQHSRSHLAAVEENAEVEDSSEREKETSLCFLRRSPVTIFVMSVFSVIAAVAGAVALVQTAGVRNAVSSVGNVAGLLAEATWSLRAENTGCDNWLEIQLGDLSLESSADLCGERCQDTNGCVGFGYQTDPCPMPEMGSMDSGACLLWKGLCESGPNTCWNDYLLARPVVPAACPAPLEPTFIGGGKGCGDVCLNMDQPYGILQEAWNACGIVLECGVIVESNGYYYLRRSSDPESTDGQSLIYSCESASEAFDLTAAGIVVNTDPSAASTSSSTATITSSNSTNNSVAFVLENIDYTKLKENPQLYEEVLKHIKEELAEEWNVGVEDVHIDFAGA